MSRLAHGSDELVTGDAVVLDQRSATAATRIVSSVIDVIIELLALSLALTVAGIVGAAGPAIAAAAALVGVVGVLVGYPVAMEMFCGGRTLAKMALGLRVVRDDGGPVRFWQSLLRGLTAFGEVWLTFGTVALIASLASSKGKRLGDLLAGTIVIRERSALPIGTAIAMPYGAAAWASTLHLSALRDDLALSARQFLVRGSSLSPAARADLAGRLAAAVGAVVTPARPAAMPEEIYLATVLAERTRREIVRISTGPAWRGPAGVGGVPVAHPPQPQHAAASSRTGFTFPA